MSTDDPLVALLDQALMTLDTYRARSSKMSSATAAWRGSDAARIAAALPAVGLVLVTRDAFERVEAVLEAARQIITARNPSLQALGDALAAYDAAEPIGDSHR